VKKAHWDTLNEEAHEEGLHLPINHVKVKQAGEIQYELLDAYLHQTPMHMTQQ